MQRSNAHSAATAEDRARAIATGAEPRPLMLSILLAWSRTLGAVSDAGETPGRDGYSARVAAKADAARSMSSSVWAAESCVRIRACPIGTTG